MAVVMTGATGLTSVGAVTDLTSREIAAIPSHQAVSHDDVIALYRWLEQEDRVPQALTNLISR